MRGEGVLAENAQHLLRQPAIGKAERRQVEGDKKSPGPGLNVGERLVQKRVCQLAYVASPLGDWDQDRGRQQAAPRMVPSREHLASEHGPGPQVHQRLVVGNKLASFDRRPNFAFERASMRIGSGMSLTMRCATRTGKLGIAGHRQQDAKLVPIRATSAPSPTIFRRRAAVVRSTSSPSLCP